MKPTVSLVTTLLLILSIPPLAVDYASEANGHEGKAADRYSRPEVAAAVAAGAPQQQPEVDEERQLPANDDEKWVRYGVYVNGAIALATLAVALFSVIQARAAKLNAQALIDSERAWVFVAIGEIPKEVIRGDADPAKIETLWVIPVLRNVGKTPARITSASARPHQIALGSELPPEPEYQVTHAIGQQMLPPGAAFGPMRAGVSLSDFQACNRGEKSLYIYGYVLYYDLADKQRETRFCYRWITQAGYDPSPSGFYIDPKAPKTYTKYT